MLLEALLRRLPISCWGLKFCAELESSEVPWTGVVSILLIWSGTLMF